MTEPTPPATPQPPEPVFVRDYVVGLWVRERDCWVWRDDPELEKWETGRPVYRP